VRILMVSMSLRWNRIIAALTLLPVLVMAVAASTLAMRCQMLGKVVAACCCPAKATSAQGAQADAQAEAQAAPSTRIERQGCCQFEQREVAQPAGELASSFVPTAPLLVALRLPPAPPRAPAAAALERAEHRDPAPPLLLLKQAFLI
jgi:hypothetical protein